MKMHTFATALALSMCAGIAHANDFVVGANELCVFDSNGIPLSDATWGGTVCDEQVDGSLASPPSSGAGNVILSPQTFIGSNWTTHDIITYAPGSYSVNTGTFIYNFTVNPGQIGVSLLLDWNIFTDIDVVNIWDVTYDGVNTTMVSTDWDGDGIPGVATVDDGLFGFSINFNLVVQGDFSSGPVAIDDNGGDVFYDAVNTINVIANDIFFPAVAVTVC